MYYMGQSMYYMSSFSIPTTNPCITWVGHVLHGLITHVIHVLGMYYMSCSCITWVSIPIMHPCNAWVPLHYTMHYMGSHALHGTPQVLHEDAHHTCASNWCHMTFLIFVYAVWSWRYSQCLRLHVRRFLRRMTRMQSPLQIPVVVDVKLTARSRVRIIPCSRSITSRLPCIHGNAM